MKKLLTKIKGLFQSKFEIVYYEGYGYTIKQSEKFYCMRGSPFTGVCEDYAWIDLVMNKPEIYKEWFFKTAEEAKQVANEIITLRKMQKPKTIETIYYTILICVTLSSCSGHYSANVGGISHHFSERKGNKEYNEVHNNIGLQYEMNVKKAIKVGLLAETYENSLNKRSNLGAVTMAYVPNDIIELGLAGGAITGYKYPVGGFGYIRLWANKYLGLRLACAPKVVNSGFCAVSASVRFN